MYSGTTLTSFSGRIIGAHQKIDRVARRHVEDIMPGTGLPKIKTILHFEGDNGPDAIKRKSPSKDEPWHFLQPYDEDDTQLIDQITEHYKQLVIALKGDNDEKLVELRSGQEIGTRTNLKERLVMSGEKPSRQVKNNWKMWGPKGLFTTHAAFECGVATLIAPLNLRNAVPSEQQISDLTKEGLAKWYRQQAKDIADWKLYDTFYKSGWTTGLARRVRKELAPKLVCVVTAVWYSAAKEALKG
jgi:hypothetical protein